MNKECEYNKFSKKEVEEMIDELTGTKFLSALAITNHLKACEEENVNYKQALINIKDKLLCWGEALDPKFQDECLQIIDEVLGGSYE